MAYTTVNNGSLFMNPTLYTGNGSTQSITGVGFQPDLTWIKSRNMNYDQNLFDVIRGTTKRLQANFNSAETTVANSVTAFGTDGFTVGSDAGVNGVHTFASWNWLGANGTAANTDGSISSTVSASATSGFSIVKFTGTGANGTVGHGLGSVPKMIIFKELAQGYAWRVYHQALGNTQKVELNVTNAVTTDATAFNSTSPTSTVFSVGSSGGTNYNGSSIIAYCFADVQGYSKFGSYTGNGNADGTFVYTGFKSSFILLKKSSGAGTDWYIFNNKSPGYNDNNKSLRANTTATEASASGYSMDILSNGFKIRTSNTALGESGATYIYMAFGQSIVGSNNVPNNAR